MFMDFPLETGYFHVKTPSYIRCKHLLELAPRGSFKSNSRAARLHEWIELHPMATFKMPGPT